MYRVDIPINTDKKRLGRGASVSDAEVDSWGNKEMLLREKFISRSGDDGLYIVCKAFSGDGVDWTPGDFVDLREKTWRNTKALLDSRYLRVATAEEVAQAMPPKVSSSTVSASSPPEKSLGNEAYLRRRYLDEMVSGTSIAKEIGCRVPVVYEALRKFNIPIRKRGYKNLTTRGT